MPVAGCLLQPCLLHYHIITHMCAAMPGCLAAARLLSADRAALRLAWIQQANRAM
jgi:hypothetical protein